MNADADDPSQPRPAPPPFAVPAPPPGPPPPPPPVQPPGRSGPFGVSPTPADVPVAPGTSAPRLLQAFSASDATVPQQPRRAAAIVAIVAAVVVFVGAFGLGRAQRIDSAPPPAPMAAASDDRAARDVADAVEPAVVNVNTTLTGGGKAAGTGMLLTGDGVVLTNNHVIDGAVEIVVELSTGELKPARVLGYDVADDVAVIKLKNVDSAPTVKLGDSSKLAVGDPVTAIGNALGKGGAPTVTSGIVAGLNQTITAGDASGANAEVLKGMIQISAEIQPGDSGGPLVNAAGEVVGMNTAAASGGGFRQANANVAFAIPINSARAIAEAIQAGKESALVHVGERGYLGVTLQPTTRGSRSAGAGAVVSAVQAGSPAAAAGIEAGDVITAIGSTPIAGPQPLDAAMSPYHPGDKVAISWVDTDGQRHSQAVVLVTGPTP